MRGCQLRNLRACNTSRRPLHHRFQPVAGLEKLLLSFQLWWNCLTPLPPLPSLTHLFHHLSAQVIDLFWGRKPNRFLLPRGGQSHFPPHHLLTCSRSHPPTTSLLACFLGGCGYITPVISNFQHLLPPFGPIGKICKLFHFIEVEEVLAPLLFGAWAPFLVVFFKRGRPPVQCFVPRRPANFLGRQATRTKKQKKKLHFPS